MLAMSDSLAQSNVTGNCQQEDPLFGDCKRNPDFVVKAFHDSHLLSPIWPKHLYLVCFIITSAQTKSKKNIPMYLINPCIECSYALLIRLFFKGCAVISNIGGIASKCRFQHWIRFAGGAGHMTAISESIAGHLISLDQKCLSDYSSSIRKVDIC